MNGLYRRGSGLAAVLFTALGCGGTPDVNSDEAGGAGGSGGSAGSSAASGGTGATGTGGSIQVGGKGGTGNESGKGGKGGSDSGDPCNDECGPGQRCETDDDGDGSCVDNDCGDLDCDDDEECQPAAGGGNLCVDISCDDDVDCPINRFCDGDICVDDVCEPGARSCDGEEVIVCSQNGGEEAAAYECGSAGYFTSSCDASTGSAGCGCEDDWDCPEFTACEAGTCVGRGAAPTCTLPPVAFEDVPPQREFRWGGTNADDTAAAGSPFAWAGQVVSTPIVMNLDDDNGDGKINELDFPEIVFMSYDDDVGGSGVVRALHGGGPNKGKDFFALCGSEHWFEGDALTDDCDPSEDGENHDDARARPGGAVAAGDLDGDGFPEIVVPLEGGALQLLNNRGEIITTYEGDLRDAGPWNYPSPAIANIDFAGLAEIVVGNSVVTLVKNGTALAFDRVFKGTESNGTMHHSGEENHHGPTVCVGDLRPDLPGLEIVAGPTAYRVPDAPADCAAPNDTSDYCQGRLTVVWDAPALDDDDTVVNYENGFCAIADVWGANVAAAPGPDNALDRKPEVILVSDGELLVLDGASGEVILEQPLGGGEQGGAPNIDDFDGDGFPEIATALADFYTVVDLQAPTAECPAWDEVLGIDEAPPGANADRAGGEACDSDADCDTPGTTCNEMAGRCVCFHNSWLRDTEDDSSKVTSSSVFDFNGDGAAEVVYNDECYFRIYDGATGGLYLALPSISRTIDENPVVADVDNDGNAEIIFATNNDTLRCEEGGDPQAIDSWPDGEDDVPVDSLPNGLEVWGDPTDVWVAARRVWNQHSYHVTNVTEGGSIPSHEPESWRPLNGRLYNTFRSQPRSYGVAPDLALTAIQVSSPDEACGELSDTIQIAVEVRNQGDLRVGPGVIIEFFGEWVDPDLDEALENEDGDPLTFTLATSLEPGFSTIITVEYERGRNDRDELPVTVRAVIDGNDMARECDEDNNSIDGPVEGGARVADLRVVVEDAAGCSEPEIQVTVHNDGSEEASDVLVRIYAGDPSQGGTLLGETTIDGPIDAGDSETVTITLDDPLSLNVTIWAVVDPLNTIAECNDGNNSDQGPDLICDNVPR
jgi:hypothetical protein